MPVISCLFSTAGVTGIYDSFAGPYVFDTFSIIVPIPSSVNSSISIA